MPGGDQWRSMSLKDHSCEQSFDFSVQDFRPSDVVFKLLEEVIPSETLSEQSRS